jgi:hypothetical protein
MNINPQTEHSMKIVEIREKTIPISFASMPMGASIWTPRLPTQALSRYDLFWYEEPGDPLDFELQAIGFEGKADLYREMKALSD